MAPRRATSEPPSLRRSARISELASQQEALNAIPNNAISGHVTVPLKRKRAPSQTKAAKSQPLKKRMPKGKTTQKGKATTRGMPCATRITRKLSDEKTTATKATTTAAKRKAPATKAAKKAVPSSKQKQKYNLLKSKDNEPQELPHNLGPIPGSLAVEIGPAPALEINDSDKENQTLKDEGVVNEAADLHATGDTAATTADDQKTANPASETKKAKRPAYRLTPGQTPYPKWIQPTPEECAEVNRRLANVHGEAKPPPKLQPSLTVAGCGEVPCVLDALIRTLLSGATSGNNSALAFDGLVKRFGILQEGIGKGSVNWDAVRRAPLRDVFEAIKRGGLADIKSKNLKAILDKVYEENQEQRKRLQSNDGSFDEKHPGMSPEKAEQAKEYEIACAEQNVLSLNHLHTLDTDDVMNELTKYPGIGPKTAACVILFCLQRPCFAVDTHIFRISKWLGWVPPEANEIMAFKHLDVRIPDEFKYSLHQLFIRHGKTCPRCRAITGEKSVGWEEGCPIDELVQRTGVRKGGVPQKAKRPRKSLKRKRTSTAKERTAKRKAAGKKAATAKRNPPRKTRSQKKNTSANDTAPEDSSSPASPVEDTLADLNSSEIASSPPAANQDEVTIPATPTPENNGDSDPSASEENEDGTTQAVAAEEADSATDASDEESDDDEKVKDEASDEEEWNPRNRE